MKLRSRLTLLAALGATASIGLAVASPARADHSCFFTGGACGAGTLYPDQTTPWTGNYYNRWVFIWNRGANPKNLAVGWRPCTGCAGSSYNFPNTQPGWVAFPPDLGYASRQQWCRNWSTTTATVTCGFDSTFPVGPH